MLEPIKIEAGLPLCTKNPERLTNAVVLSREDLVVTILTDFGNTLKMSLNEVQVNYTIPEWYQQAVAWEFPLETLEERIDKQIELLTTARGLL